jgi:hypothetical protein
MKFETLMVMQRSQNHLCFRNAHFFKIEETKIFKICYKYEEKSTILISSVTHGMLLFTLNSGTQNASLNPIHICG